MKQLIDPYEYGGAVFQVGEADSEEEKNACYRLRFESYCLGNHPDDKPRFDPKDYPDGLETGPEDEYAHMLIVTMTVGEETTTVGTFRFTPCDKGFFTEGKPFGDGFFTLPDSHLGVPVSSKTTLEGGRWIGHPAFTPEGDRVFLVHLFLAEAARVMSLQYGFTHWVCVIDHEAAKNGRSSDWPLNEMVPGVHMYLGVMSEACIVPLNDPTSKYHAPRLGPSVMQWRARLAHKREAAK